MAAPSPRQNLWLTLVAAAVTVAVLAGVLVGPLLLRCADSASGLAACLRQEVVEAGLLPQPEAPVAPPAIAAPDPEPPVVADIPAGPELSLIRAAPDGSLVVAGTGQPGITVQVFANDIVVGEAVAEPSGDWVVVPEAPIVTGGAEITVGLLGENRRSERSFLVVIQPDRKSEPLVVASTPGEASEVIQGPPEAAPAPVATPVEPLPEPETLPPEPAPPAPEPEAVAPEPAPVAPEPEVPVPAPEAIAPEPEVQAPDPTIIANAPEPEPIPLPALPVPAAQPTIDAIEIDGEANFFAGAGMEGATVRLYVEDRFVADARVEGGRWLVEARGALTLPRQRVRIDMLRPQSADVSARAEVNFVIELPGAPEIGIGGSASGGANPGATAGTDLSIPTLTAIQTDPEKLRFASGKAIIRRGENLWTIARRVYGDGLKYTTIFEANRTQMRNPGQIYPGQVFDLPQAEK